MADSVSLGLVGSCCEAVLPMLARDWMTVILRKSCAKPLRVSACFFPQSLDVEAASGSGQMVLSIILSHHFCPRRTQMNRTARTLVTLALSTLLTGSAFAQVTGETIHQRKENQQARIRQGVRSGELTRGETRNLESRGRSVNREERAMRRVNGGRLTAADKAALARRQNRISRSIYRDKHNTLVR
jgi:hypothetical protein